MARYSQGRSIRSFGIGSNRRMQSLQMHQIRRQSIGYILHQMFWRGEIRRLIRCPLCLETIPADLCVQQPELF